jgi:hypothetical protein
MNFSKLFAVQLLADAFYNPAGVTHRNPGVMDQNPWPATVRPPEICRESTMP